MHLKNSRVKLLKISKKIYFILVERLILLLLGLIISLILTESVFYILPKVKAGYSLNRFSENNPVMKVLNKPDCILHYRPSSILNYERIPNSGPNINSYGMIGREYRLKKPKDTYRILILGDSITEFDWYVKILEGSLNNFSNSSCKFELWNAGVGGYEVNQYANYLKFKGIKYQPDMVIIGFCLNDFNIAGTRIINKDRNGFSGYYYSGMMISKDFPINNFLFTHSYLYRYMLINIDKLLTKIRLDDYIDRRIATGSIYLGEIKKICKKKKIPLFTVIFPYLKPLKEYSRVEIEEYKSMLAVLKTLDIEYIDLHSYFSAEKIKSLRSYKEDYIHPSKEGHEIAAKVIYDYLVEKYFRDSVAYEISINI